MSNKSKTSNNIKRCRGCNKDLEEELGEIRERYELLSAAALEGIVIHDKGKIIEVNRRLAEMFGYKPEELIGKSGFSMLEPESQKRLAEHVASGSTEPYEVRCIKKDGSTFYSEIRAKNIRYQGRPMRIGALYDITALKKVEEVLKEKVEELQKINQMMVGRELKMAEIKAELAVLKDEIKRLKIKK